MKMRSRRHFCIYLTNFATTLHTNLDIAVCPAPIRGGTSSILYLAEPPPPFYLFFVCLSAQNNQLQLRGMTSWESVRFAYGALGTLAHIAPIGPLACALANALLTPL